VSDDAAPQPAPNPVSRTRDHTDIQSFCWLIANGMTGTEAARQAAIRQKIDDPPPPAPLAVQRAGKLLKRADVQDLIATMKQRVADDLATKYGVTRETVLRDLIDVKNRCMQAEPVLDGEGNPTGEYKFDSTGAINALKLIGQDLGMFVKRIEHRHTLSNLTDEQLLERARNAAIQLTAIEAAVDDSGAIGADPATRGDRRGDPPAIN
jgi:phage terminase small subunit